MMSTPPGRRDRSRLCGAGGLSAARSRNTPQKTPMLIPNFVTLVLYLMGCNGGLM